MPGLCPWSLDTLKYDGCCGHVSLAEKVQGCLENLAPEQIDALDAQRKLRNSRRDRKTRGPERVARDQKNKREKALASNKFACNLCNVSFGANNQLDNHELTEKHINNVNGIIKPVKNPTAKARMARDLAAKKYHCSSCDYSASTRQKLNRHFQRPTHRDKVAALAQSSS